MPSPAAPKARLNAENDLKPTPASSVTLVKYLRTLKPPPGIAMRADSPIPETSPRPAAIVSRISVAGVLVKGMI